MARRHKAFAPPRLGLVTAIRENLLRMERAVAYQTVIKDIKFTAMDVVEWLLPSEHIQTLQRAYPLIRDYDRANFQGECVCHLEQPGEPEEPVKFILMVATHRRLNMQGWRPEATEVQPASPWHRTLVNTFIALRDVNRRFKAVHDVADWLDLNATWGAVRYYWPSACALLPNDHLIHRLDGNAHKEPKAPVGPMVPQFRSTAMTVTEGLLCPFDIPASTDLVTASFNGTVFQLL